jgi:2,4-dienoyl-CoA reductase-like NADH-dependent reductase (Old Yellow Enzyme family)
LSCDEWANDTHKEKWVIEDTIKLVKVLKEKGVDVIDCSAGFNTSEGTLFTKQIFFF